MNKEIINKIKLFTEKRLENADNAHDYAHAERVTKLSRKIYGTRPKLDLVIAAAYLHDISYRDEVEKYEDHVVNSKLIAEKFLDSLEHFTHNEIQEIINIMHAGSSENYLNEKKKLTFEQKTLQDAGILDAIGAIGIARLFIFAGHFKEDISSAIAYLKTNLIQRTNLLQTSKGKQIGLKRAKFLKKFLEQYLEEQNIE